MTARTFELSDELSARLDELAAGTGRSADAIVRAALEQRLEQIEEDQRNRGLLERIADRLQEIDYTPFADESIAKIVASEMQPDPLEAITTSGPDYGRMSRAAMTGVTAREGFLSAAEVERLVQMIIPRRVGRLRKRLGARPVREAKISKRDESK